MDSGNAKFNAIAAELLTYVSKRIPDVRIDVSFNDRWHRPCVTFGSPVFEGLLPEERFHRLMLIIPESFREKRMAGFVWLELSPGESVEQFLELPRSEDVLPGEARVFARLRKSKFFDSLRQALGESPQSLCGGDFAASWKILSTAKLSKPMMTDVKLVFIRHGAYCDCQVLQTVEAALSALYPDVG